MFHLLKQFLQLILFFIWCLTLINLILLSSILLIVSNVFLLIFLFWFILTLFVWSIAFIPILKYVFIPWHRRQCRVWTRKHQQKRYSVAFFHRFSDKINDQQRIHWTIIKSLLKTYSHDIEILIYTDNDHNTEDYISTIKDNFHINLNSYQTSITFIHLQSQFLFDHKYFKHFPLLTSTIISLEAILRFLPDIYIDSIGNPCTYPCFSYIGSVPILSYFQQSNLRYDLFDINSLTSRLKLIFYDCLNLIYICCANCSTKTFCNSSWLKQYLGSDDIQLLYPPISFEQYAEKTAKNFDEQTIVSIGEFRYEENHQLQIRAFHQFLQRKPEYRAKTKLILIGNNRDNEQDRDYIEQLKNLTKKLNMNDVVQFKYNLTFQQLKTQLQQATVGLSTMENDEFKIAFVEMMAADLIILAHQSGAPKLDIIKENQTGFFAYDIDSYADKLEHIFGLTADERCQISQSICDSLNRYDRLKFEKVFFSSFEKILFVK